VVAFFRAGVLCIFAPQILPGALLLDLARLVDFRHPDSLTVPYLPTYSKFLTTPRVSNSNSKINSSSKTKVRLFHQEVFFQGKICIITQDFLLFAGTKWHETANDAILARQRRKTKDAIHSFIHSFVHSFIHF